jgi:hypothetical protein
MIFVHYFVCVLYYIYLFAYIELSLYPWNEIKLIVMYDFLKCVIEFGLLVFIEFFCPNVHQENQSISLFFVVSLSAFGTRVILAT